MLTTLLLTTLALSARALPPMPGAPPRTDLPEARLPANKQAAFVIDVSLPKDWRLHPDAVFVARIAQTTGVVKVDIRKRKVMTNKPRLPVKLAFTPPEGKSEVMVQVAFYYCPNTDLDGCKAFSRYYLLPVQSDEKSKRSRISLTVKPADD